MKWKSHRLFQNEIKNWNQNLFWFQKMKGKTMAKYGYNELKVAAAEGRRIGAYMGRNVFACSKWKYDTLKSKNKDSFYVLYDEDNKLVYDGTIYGTISDKGLVDEWDRKRTWVSPQSQVEVKFEPVAPAKQKAKSQTSQTRTVPATAYSAFVAGVNDSEGIINTEDFFVRLDKEINELLATPFVFNVGEDMPWVNKA